MIESCNMLYKFGFIVSELRNKSSIEIQSNLFEVIGY